MKKIKEIPYAYNGMDVCYFNPTPDIKQGLELGLVVAEDKPKLFGIFNSKVKEIFQSQEVEEFYKKAMIVAPSLSMYIKGIGSEKSVDSEFDDLTNDDKWMFVKTVAFFGEDDEKRRFEILLENNPKIELSDAHKKELSQIKSYDTNFKDSIVKLLSVNPPLKSTRKNAMKNR